MNPRHTYIPLKWKNVDNVRSIVLDWANILYNEKRHEFEPDQTDFYLDKNLNKISSKDDIVITKWSIGNFDTAFHCITGWGLYDIYPWWREMQTFFEKDVGLKSWLPFPCLLLSKSNLRRHWDKGRPTAFNYSIFGEEIITNCIWHTRGVTVDTPPDETYSYNKENSILVDTSYDHGGYNNPGHDYSELRAIFNMGFDEEYDICLKKILESQKLGLFDKLK